MNKQMLYRRIGQLFLMDWWRLLLSMGLVIVQVATTLYLPIMIGNFIDSLTARTFNQIQVVYVLLGLISVNALCQWGLPLLYNGMIYRAMSKLRQQALDKIYAVPFQTLYKMGRGDIMNRMTIDMQQLTDGLMIFVNQWLVNILLIMAVLVMMSQLDVQLLLIVVLLTPLSLLLARQITQRSYHLFQQNNQLRSQMTQFMEESVYELRTLRTFNAQEERIHQFRSRYATYERISRQAVFVSSLVNPLTRFVNACVYAVVAMFGAYRVVQGDFSVGIFVAFLQYVMHYAKPFNEISGATSELQSALASAQRIFEWLDLPIQSTKGKLIQPVAGDIVLKDVDFAYEPSKPLIQSLSLTIREGTRVAIVGETGSGKSTLANLLMRFYSIQNGKICIGQHHIDEWNVENYWQQIGMVFQETWLQEGTIYDNIAFAKPNATQKEVEWAAQQAYANHFIEQLPNGYETYIDQSQVNLSQGQQQLIALARLFIANPNIMILDEATASIDVRTEYYVQKALSKLMAGRTTIIIAHRLATIQSSDLIVVMDNGQIIEQGTHEQLINIKGRYYQMYQVLSQ